MSAGHPRRGRGRAIKAHGLLGSNGKASIVFMLTHTTYVSTYFVGQECRSPSTHHHKRSSRLCVCLVYSRYVSHVYTTRALQLYAEKMKVPTHGAHTAEHNFVHLSLHFFFCTPRVRMSVTVMGTVVVFFSSCSSVFSTVELSLTRACNGVCSCKCNGINWRART